MAKSLRSFVMSFLFFPIIHYFWRFRRILVVLKALYIVQPWKVDFVSVAEAEILFRCHYNNLLHTAELIYLNITWYTYLESKLHVLTSESYKAKTFTFFKFKWRFFGYHNINMQVSCRFQALSSENFLFDSMYYTYRSSRT